MASEMVRLVHGAAADPLTLEEVATAMSAYEWLTPLLRSEAFAAQSPARRLDLVRSELKESRRLLAVAITPWKRGTDINTKTGKTQLTTNCYLEHDQRL